MQSFLIGKYAHIREKHNKKIEQKACITIGGKIGPSREILQALKEQKGGFRFSWNYGTTDLTRRFP
jgi:hypothetical protein